MIEEGRNALPSLLQENSSMLKFISIAPTPFRVDGASVGGVGSWIYQA
jgi:hypothetical protein